MLHPPSKRIEVENPLIVDHVPRERIGVPYCFVYVLENRFQLAPWSDRIPKPYVFMFVLRMALSSYHHLVYIYICIYICICTYILYHIIYIYHIISYIYILSYHIYIYHIMHIYHIFVLILLYIPIHDCIFLYTDLHLHTFVIVKAIYQTLTPTPG